GLVFAPIRLYAVSEWPGPRHQQTDLFRGLFLAFDLGATVRGTTFVDPPRPGPGIATRDALEAVTTGDAAFDRVFRVTASDPEEARALLVPSTRAGLLRLREEARHDVHVSIARGRVSVAVERGAGLFEPCRGAVDLRRVTAMAELFGLVRLAGVRAR